MPTSVTGLAFFDLDGTLTRHDSHVRLLGHLLRHTPLPWSERAHVLRGCAAYLAGRRSNAWTKQVVGRICRDRPRSQLREELRDWARRTVLTDLRPEGLARLREHQRCGDRVVLLSASLEWVVGPVALALEIEQHRGVSLASDPAGKVLPELDGPCYHGEAKARWVLDQGWSLEQSWAYGDSYSDRHLLELVTHPVAVSPDPRLHRLARARAWETLS